jgi:hypothetical protein
MDQKADIVAGFLNSSRYQPYARCQKSGSRRARDHASRGKDFLKQNRDHRDRQHVHHATDEQQSHQHPAAADAVGYRPYFRRLQASGATSLRAIASVASRLREAPPGRQRKSRASWRAGDLGCPNVGGGSDKPGSLAEPRGELTAARRDHGLNASLR